MPIIIQKLKEENYLDDNRYANFYVRDKFKFNRWGKIKIGFGLRQQGIPEETILSALNQLDEQAYFDTCKVLIQNKLSELKEKNLYTRKARLFKFAAQRGFESDLIYRILNILDQERT